MLGALLLALTGIPLAGVLGSTIHAGEMAASRAQAASRYLSTAVTLADGKDMPVATLRGPAQVPVEVPAQWSSRDGAPHTGTVFVNRETPAGSTVPVWLDETGARTTVPTSPGDAAMFASLTALLAWVALAGVLAAMVALAHWLLDRVRYRAWAREWERVGRDSSYP